MERLALTSIQHAAQARPARPARSRAVELYERIAELEDRLATLDLRFAADISRLRQVPDAPPRSPAPEA